MRLGQRARSVRGVSLSGGVTLADADEGKILFDSRRGRYWHLNEVGIEVVEGLVEGRSVRDVAQAISVRTGAEESMVHSDCEQLVQELVAAGLLKGVS